MTCYVSRKHNSSWVVHIHTVGNNSHYLLHAFVNGSERRHIPVLWTQFVGDFAKASSEPNQSDPTKYSRKATETSVRANLHSTSDFLFLLIRNYRGIWKLYRWRVFKNATTIIVSRVIKVDFLRYDEKYWGRKTRAERQPLSPQTMFIRSHKLQWIFLRLENCNEGGSKFHIVLCMVRVGGLKN